VSGSKFSKWKGLLSKIAGREKKKIAKERREDGMGQRNKENDEQRERNSTMRGEYSLYMLLLLLLLSLLYLLCLSQGKKKPSSLQ
jgi:hypothetical protein